MGLGKAGRTVGLLVLVATLTAASAGSWPVGPAPPDATSSGSPQAGFGPSDPGEAVLSETRSGERAGSAASSGASGPSASTAVSDPAPPPDDRPFVIVHVVARGETVSGIAKGYGITASTVAASARLGDPDHIYPGETLVFPSVDGLLHVIKPGDTLSEIARTYRVNSDAISQANDIDDPRALAVGRTLIVPGGKPRRAAAASIASGVAASTASGVALSWPLRGAISSSFGPRWGQVHAGIDIAASYGATIRAAGPGTVSFVGWYGRYGRCVIIDHGGGLTTLYGHASVILVSAGDRVARGDPVAEVGSSGNSTGPHCHFEVRLDGRARNPLNYLGG